MTGEWRPKRETRPRNRKNRRTHCAECGVKLTDANGYRRHESPPGIPGL